MTTWLNRVIGSPAAQVGALSRNPAGIKTIRRLRDEIGLDVEMVMLDAERAIVVAALSEFTLQPRPLTPAESLIVKDPSRLSAATPGSFTSQIAVGLDGLAVLSAQGELTDSQVIAIQSAAADLSTALVQPVPEAAAAVSGDRDPEAILATQRDVLVVLDSQLTIRYCNHAVLTTFGWTPEELLGRAATDWIHPDDVDVALGSLMRLQNADEIYRTRIRLMSASGQWVPVSVTAIDQSSNPGVRGITVSMRPAEYENENTRALRVLENRAKTDPLTGLTNRHSLHESWLGFSAKFGGLIEPSGPYAACLIGIDHFKTINDIHGHAIGDEVLRVVAERLGGASQHHDFLARMGGDEFTLISADPERAGSANRCAQTLRALLSEPYEIAGNRLHLTVSIGVAVHDRGEDSPDILLRNAGIALEAAKERGRDQVAQFDARLASAGAAAQTHRNLVREALASGRIQMQYQPIVGVNGDILGFEALARCFGSDGELHMPTDFIPPIRGTSLLVQLDREAFEQSCKFATSLDQIWPEANLFVSCNFSTKSLAQSDFVEHILTTATRIGARPSSLCIEVTESAAFEAGPLSIEALSELQRAGVGIALDDFGTGYSSLSHLRDLPLSTVKIDRSFVSALSVPGPEQTITRAITELARALGFTIILEGIETAAQLEAANLMGIDRLQGWYFDKALTAEAAHTRLVDQRTANPE